jgi:hypothetical protein
MEFSGTLAETRFQVRRTVSNDTQENEEKREAGELVSRHVPGHVRF